MFNISTHLSLGEEKENPCFWNTKKSQAQFPPETDLHLCIPAAFICKSYAVMCSCIHLRNIYGGPIEVRCNGNQGRYHSCLGDTGIVIKRRTKKRNDINKIQPLLKLGFHIYGVNTLGDKRTRDS